MKKSKKDTLFLLLICGCVLCIGVPSVLLLNWNRLPASLKETLAPKATAPATTIPIPTEVPLSPSASLLPTASPITDSLPAYSETPNRVTYAEGFYYETVSQLPELMARIRTVSFQESENDQITYDQLSYLRVRYVNFLGQPCAGELICNTQIAQDLVEIFYQLYQASYPIQEMRLIDDYNGDDLASMEANNTSCFNYRLMTNSSSTLSKHGEGMAIDLNPFYNPYVVYEEDGSQTVLPVQATLYADREQYFPCKIDKDDLAYQLFTQHGFSWGGDWKTTKDYQHFEK